VSVQAVFTPPVRTVRTLCVGIESKELGGKLAAIPQTEQVPSDDGPAGDGLYIVGGREHHSPGPPGACWSRAPLTRSSAPVEPAPRALEADPVAGRGPPGAAGGAEHVGVATSVS